MEDKKPNVCRLCSCVVCNFQFLNSIQKDMIEIIFPELDIEICSGIVICEECDQTLQDNFKFKSTCLEIEESIHNYNSNGQKQIDLDKVVGLKQMNTPCDNLGRVSKICRTCLDLTEPKDIIELIENDNNMLIEILATSFPEIDLGLTTHPIICKRCNSQIEGYYRFFNKFMENETKIKLHLENNLKQEYKSYTIITDSSEEDMFITDEIHIKPDDSFENLDNEINYNSYEEIVENDIDLINSRHISLKDIQMTMSPDNAELFNFSNIKHVDDDKIQNNIHVPSISDQESELQESQKNLASNNSGCQSNTNTNNDQSDKNYDELNTHNVQLTNFHQSNNFSDQLNDYSDQSNDCNDQLNNYTDQSNDSNDQLTDCNDKTNDHEVQINNNKEKSSNEDKSNNVENKLTNGDQLNNNDGQQKDQIEEQALQKNEQKRSFPIESGCDDTNPDLDTETEENCSRYYTRKKKVRKIIDEDDAIDDTNDPDFQIGVTDQTEELDPGYYHVEFKKKRCTWCKVLFSSNNIQRHSLTCYRKPLITKENFHCSFCKVDYISMKEFNEHVNNCLGTMNKDCDTTTKNRDTTNRDGDTTNRNDHTINKDSDITNRDGDITNRDGFTTNRDGDIIKKDEHTTIKVDDLVTPKVCPHCHQYYRSTNHFRKCKLAIHYCKYCGSAQTDASTFSQHLKSCNAYLTGEIAPEAKITNSETLVDPRASKLKALGTVISLQPEMQVIPQDSITVQPILPSPIGNLQQVQGLAPTVQNPVSVSSVYVPQLIFASQDMINTVINTSFHNTVQNISTNPTVLNAGNLIQFQNVNYSSNNAQSNMSELKILNVHTLQPPNYPKEGCNNASRDKIIDKENNRELVPLETIDVNQSKDFDTTSPDKTEIDVVHSTENERTTVNSSITLNSEKINVDHVNVVESNSDKNIVLVSGNNKTEEVSNSSDKPAEVSNNMLVPFVNKEIVREKCTDTLKQNSDKTESHNMNTTKDYDIPNKKCVDTLKPKTKTRKVGNNSLSRTKNKKLKNGGIFQSSKLLQILNTPVNLNVRNIEPSIEIVDLCSEDQDDEISSYIMKNSISHILAVLKCDNCEFNTRKNKVMETHVLKHLQVFQMNNGIHRCIYCGEFFNNGNMLRDHQKTLHNVRNCKQYYWCVNCATLLHNLEQIKDHQCLRRQVKMFKSNGIAFCMSCNFENPDNLTAKLHLRLCSSRHDSCQISEVVEIDDD